MRRMKELLSPVTIRMVGLPGHLPMTDGYRDTVGLEESHMKLLPEGITTTLPPLYATETTPVEQKALHVKLFDPYTQWTWYACEYDPKERVFFGYVVGQEKEWGGVQSRRA